MIGLGVNLWKPTRSVGGGALIYLDFGSMSSLPSWITYTGASAKTMFDDAGLLVWAPHNLLTYSEQFDNAAWAKTRVQAFGSGSVANATTAPDGTATADKIVEIDDASTSTTHSVSVGPTLPAAGVSVTLSIYAKAAERSRIILQENINGVSVGVNLTTGAIASGSGTVTPVGNGWYRISVTVPSASSTSIIFAVYLHNGTSSAYDGDGTSGIYLWGAQLNYGTTALDYCATTSAAYYGPALGRATPSGIKGLHAWPLRTNKITYSNDPSNAAWSKTNLTVTGGATTGLDGLASGWKIEATTTASVNFRGPSWTNNSTSACAYAIVKKGTSATHGNTFYLYNATTASIVLGVTFNYDTQEIAVTAGAGSYGAIDMGGGWWMVWLSATSGITSGDSLRVYPGTTGGPPTAGDHHYLYHAQGEEGATYPSPPIPTTTGTASRAADLSIISAANLTSLIGAAAVTALQSHGTMVVEFAFEGGSSALGGDRIAACLGNAAATGRHIVYNNGGGAGGFSSSTNFASSSVAGAVAAGSLVKIAYAYASNNSRACANGASGGLDTDCATMPSWDSIGFGHRRDDSSAGLGGVIRRIWLFDRRITDAELQGLTA